MSEMKQVIVLRKDLNMRKGKMVAQGAHASMKAILAEASGAYGVLTIKMSDEMEKWLMGIFTKICVSVDSEEELLAIYQTAKDVGLHCSLIQDVGLTEFDGVRHYTAVAVGPGDPADIDPITGNLKLL